MAIYIAEVKDIEDLGKDGQVTDGNRIKVRLLPRDQYKSLDELPYAFPLLPKMFHIKPKVGESVFILTADEGNQNSQRYYIGPIISQPQKMNYDSYIVSSTSLLNGSITSPEKAPSINQLTEGSYANDSEIGLYSRGDTDIILGDKDLRIRCGSRKFSNSMDSFEFNRKNPSFIKLKEHDSPINSINGNDSTTSASIVADEINLLSHNGSPYFNLTDNSEQITDDEMKNIIAGISEKAHVLPYGDVLVDFLTMFLQMFKSHTHKYLNMPPCPDSCSQQLDMKYGSGTGTYSDEQYDYSRGTKSYNRFEDASKTFKGLGEKLLSKHIRIN